MSGSPGQAGRAPASMRVVLPLAVALALSVLVGVAVGGPDYLPTGDGPQHVFNSYAARHLVEGPPNGYGHALRTGAVFVSVGFDTLFGFWLWLMPWRAALRASLVTMALLWAWGVMALVAAVDRRRAWVGLLGFAGAAQWLLYLGFFDFMLAVGVGFYVLAVALLRWPWPRLWRLAVGAGLTVQAMIHPVPAWIGGFVLFVLVLFRAGRAHRVRELAGLAPMAVPVLLIQLSTFAGAGDTEAWLPSLRDRIEFAVRGFVAGPCWRSWLFPGLALLGAAAALRARCWKSDVRQGALLAAGLCLALTAALAPVHLPGWQFFNMRFSGPAAVVLVALLPVERLTSGAWRAGVAVALTAYAVASNAWAIGYGRRLEAASADLVAGLDAPIRRSGFRLPVIVEPFAGQAEHPWERPVPFHLPNWNIGSVFAVAQGGLPRFAFAGHLGVHRVLWRPEVTLPPVYQRGLAADVGRSSTTPGARLRELVRLLSYGPYYQDVIFFGRPDDIPLLRSRGFVIDFERGGLAIARFQPTCPVHLDLVPAGAGLPATLVQFGWAPSPEPTFSLRFPAEPERREPRAVSVPESGCGPVWFRVLFDEDGSGSASPGDRTCLEASQVGVVELDAGPGSPRAVCRAARLLPLAR